MADPSAQGRLAGGIQTALKIPGDSVFLPITVSGGGKLARFLFHRIDRFGRGHRIVGPVRGLFEGFGGFGFLLGHTILTMRMLALGFKHR